MDPTPDPYNTKDPIARLVESALRRAYRELAHAYFGDILASISIPSRDDLARLLEAAADSGIITVEDMRDVLFSDLVLLGVRRADRRRAYLVAEVSSSISDADVQRALRRAALLQRVTGDPAIPAVAGERIHQDADSAARALGVWRVLDDITLGPSDPAPTDRVVPAQA
jgi:hypothetical protein